MTLRPFHLAVTVDDLAEARRFYGGFMGCAEGRSAERWVDFDLFGHQFVCHLDERKNAVRPEPVEGQDDGDALPVHTSTSSVRTVNEAQNIVDGHGVPVPHFGIVLTMADWQALAQRLNQSGVAFDIAPTIRFAGEVGEQATMFFRDPAGNALEFKAFADDAMLFAT